MVTKMLFFVLLIGCCLMTGVAASESLPPSFKGHTSLVRVDPPLSPFRRDVDFEYRPELQINRSLTCRTLVILDEANGTGQLRRLTLTSDVEEHWAYLPGLKTWVEIGFNETPGTATIDFDYLHDLMTQHEELVVYHIHLRNYLENAKKELQLDIPDTWLIVPSFSDIALMIYFTSQFYALHPGGDISWKIGSPLGLTTYGLTEEGMRHYRTITDNAFLLTYFCPGREERIDGRAVPVFDLSAPHSTDDLMQWVNTQCKDMLKVTFQPYTKP